MRKPRGPIAVPVAFMRAGLNATSLAPYVVGPSSSTDNAVVRFDGTTGKLIKNSAVTIDDGGNVSGGQYNGQTISSTASFTGTVTVSGFTRLNGRVGLNTAGATNVGLMAAPSLTAAAGGAYSVWAGGSLTTAANNDQLIALVIPGGSGTSISNAGAFTNARWRGISVNQPSTVTGTFAEFAGIYVGTISGGTANYAVYTNSGLVRFGDAVTMTSTLAVTGNITGGTYNSQTISSTASFTGTVAVATSLTSPSVLGVTSLETPSTLTISGTGETLATFVDDGAVTLYHNNTARIATSSTGVSITGALAISGALSATAITATSNLSVGSSITVAGVIQRDVDTASLVLRGGLGFFEPELTIYGSSHATRASYLEFNPDGVNVVMQYNASLEVWSFDAPSASTTLLSLSDTSAVGETALVIGLDYFGSGVVTPGRVEFGAADSAGTGYRVLRILN